MTNSEPRPGYVVQFARVSETNPTAADLRTQQRVRFDLPIRPDGWVSCTLPVPDRWAHRYRVAWRIVRRYDAVWRSLERSSDNESEIVDIDDSKFRGVRVDRSAGLVPPTIIATPLAGSMRGILFKHPVDFAAQARADEAGTGQNSGSTVYLIRRLPESVEKKLVTIFKEGLVNPDYPQNRIKWDKYQTWIKSDMSGRVGPIEPKSNRIGPKLDQSSDGQETLAFEPVTGTETGTPDADEFVFPDLPGYYYQYRLAAFQTAGRARSDVALTPYVSPLYDGPRYRESGGEFQVFSGQGRQRPWTYPVTEASFDKKRGKLAFKVRLVPPRLHMPPEVASLWIDADRRLKPSGSATCPEITYGSLPDLELSYLIFFRASPDSDVTEAPAARVSLTPGCVILPPEDKNGNNWFQLDIINTSLVPVGVENGEQPFPIYVEQSQQSGELYLKPEFIVDRKSPLYEQLSKADPKAISGLIYIAVQRKGVLSTLVRGKTAGTVSR